MQLTIDGIPFLLKSPQAFPWLSAYGRVFRVYDRLSSGNLCFGVDGPYGKLFIKYAGAETINYSGRLRDAVQTLKNAMPLYIPARQHLVQLLAYGEVGEGYAAVFRYEEGECLHGTPVNRSVRERLRQQPDYVRLRMLDGLFSLQNELALDGLLAVDFCDANIILDFELGTATLCDLDLYRMGASINDRGRMPGTPYFLAPEEYKMEAPLDAQTTVYHLGALAFEFFGDNYDRSLKTWEGPRVLWQVAARAVSEEKHKRYSSVEKFLKTWREAVGKAKFR